MQNGLSLTCEVSPEPGVQWFATKESGLTPRLCDDFYRLVAPYPVVSAERSPPCLFVVKVMGHTEQLEVFVVPLALSTVEWFEEHRLVPLLSAVRSGDWNAVVHILHSLLCQPACLEGCEDCVCEQKELWAASGWRRVVGVELNAGNTLGWWKGITDAVGDDPRDGRPWLRCPCGTSTPQ